MKRIRQFVVGRWCWLLPLGVAAAAPIRCACAAQQYATTSTSPLVAAFAAAGGGGGGGFGRKGAGGNAASVTRTSRSKKNRKKGELLRDEELIRTPDNRQQVDGRDNDDSQPKLDKWGLPEPTEEDLFPPMPPGTELLAATKERYSLQEIRQALGKHVPLDLGRRFDEDGVEMTPADGPVGVYPMRLRLLHVSPPVLAIENFFSARECADTEGVAMPPGDDNSDSDDYLPRPVRVDSKTFALAQSTRTSTSWFCHYAQVPALLAKAHHCLGIPLDRMEEPQVVRYKKGQQFSWHYDEVPAPQLSNGGQRVATLLVYLNTVDAGGGTVFRDLTDRDGNALTMKPVQGSALLFFPALGDGTPDDRTLHKGEVAQDEKRIVQMWIHERPYRAVVPPGNSQEAARDEVDRVSRELGYII